MSEYGSGISMMRAFALDKERIKHAFKGELICGESENGFEYAPASKEECEAYILSAYDNAVYYAILNAASGRALERIYHSHVGKLPDMKEYMTVMEQELLKDDESREYFFEADWED